MAKSDYERNGRLNADYGSGTPPTIYVALFTSAPTVSGGGTEVSGGSYARAAVTNNSANWPAAVAGAKSNANAVTFPQATALWGTVVAVGIFDALMGGNLLDFAMLTTPRTVNNGDTFSFPVGDLAFQET
jgi:hypothetical protein